MMRCAFASLLLPLVLTARWRLINDSPISVCWVVSEVTFYSDTACTNTLSHNGPEDLEGGKYSNRPFASSHASNHTPNLAFDGNSSMTGTSWKTIHPAKVGEEFIGYDFDGLLPANLSVGCVKLAQQYTDGKWGANVVILQSSSDKGKTWRDEGRAAGLGWGSKNYIRPSAPAPVPSPNASCPTLPLNYTEYMQRPVLQDKINGMTVYDWNRRVELGKTKVASSLSDNIAIIQENTSANYIVSIRLVPLHLRH